MKTIQVRISDCDKKAVEKILQAMGLDLPTAIRAFLKKVEQVHGIPFALTARPELDENGLTEEQNREIDQRIADAEAGINVSPEFDNMEDAIAYLRSE